MSDFRFFSRRRALQATGGLLGAAALGGPGAAQTGGGTGTADGSGSQQGGPSPKRIGMYTSGDGRNFYTVPFRWVEPGTTVIWQLVQGSHSTTAYASANDRPHRIPEEAPGWDSGVASEPGATFERTFNVEGVYDYHCTPHESIGMVGRLVVGAPDPENEPALAEPPESLPATAREALSGLNAVTRVMFGP